MLNLWGRRTGAPWRWRQSASLNSQPKADVCLIVEGSYPYVAGGVASWLDWLMRTQPHLSFAVIAIVSGHEARQMRYELPDNVVHFSQLNLHGDTRGRRASLKSRELELSAELARLLTGLARGGGLAEYARLVEIVNNPRHPLSLYDVLQSPLSFKIIRGVYNSLMPHSSFHQFYWAWRALFGGLFRTLKFDLPDAGVYHAISTGYAGLLAARASVETGRPAAITEHGIYTNERRIEILMADWISDSVEKGLALDDTRTDLRDLWIKVFESYARACYSACSVITTLYGDNQKLQHAEGAETRKLRVIANGVDLSRFENLSLASQDDQPTMALIGRVVPIKDVKTYISAAGIVRDRFPNLRALVMGPTDEDPDYFEECRQLVAELDLTGCITFTGGVRITDLMPSIHVIVLTSLSEAQPLVLLEGGAAGIPCVATNVGACSEIINGSSEEEAPQPGGYVTDLVAPEQVADSVCRLLASEAVRREFGEALRRRVRASYASDMARQKYSLLYQEFLERQAS